MTQAVGPIVSLPSVTPVQASRTRDDPSRWSDRVTAVRDTSRLGLVMTQAVGLIVSLQSVTPVHASGTRDDPSRWSDCLAAVRDTCPVV